MRIKKSCIFAALAALLFVFTAGCGAQDKGADAVQAHEDSITAVLEGDVVTSIVTVSEDGGRYDLTVSVSSRSDVSEFGNCVLAVKAAFESEFEEDVRGRFSVSQPIDSKNTALIRFSSSDYSEGVTGLSGTLSDTRSGEVVITKISSIEDLAEKYPAVLIYAEEKGYTN